MVTTHLIERLLNALKGPGKLVLVGVPEKSLEVVGFLDYGGKIVVGSNIGGLEETQEMLDFAAEHRITADVEVILIDYVNTTMERILKSDVSTYLSPNFHIEKIPPPLSLPSGDMNATIAADQCHHLRMEDVNATTVVEPPGKLSIFDEEGI
ncbi:unnamed protein product [Lactuca virosa]|uniref:Uncharacterized protein n=1 Tax=Lactuca virosa TaxID=75947 RepID=A0AAU9PT99_9ASTR|nr:unnamed protein product [Lactuca virosa]